MKKLLLALILLPSIVFGSTYYASPTGSGTTCTSSSPCTLTYAVDTKAGSGDTVHVNAGTYEGISDLQPASGVTIEGECTISPCDPDNNDWLSIIVGFEAASTWTETSETYTPSGSCGGKLGCKCGSSISFSGKGIHKQTFSEEVWGVVEEDSGVYYHIPRLFGDDGSEFQDWGCYISKDIDDLNEQTEGIDSAYWNIFGATAYSDGTTTYIAYGDDTDPDTKNIYVSFIDPLMDIDTKSNITITGLKFVTGRMGIEIDGSTNITVKNSYFTGAPADKEEGSPTNGSFIDVGGSTNPSDGVKIYNNIFEIKYMDTTYDPGAWQGADRHVDTTVTLYGAREGLYNTLHDEAHRAVAIKIGTQTNSEVYSNIIRDVYVGVELIGNLRGSFHDNLISGSVGTGIIVFAGVGGSSPFYSYNNTFFNSTSHVRWQGYNSGNGGIEQYWYNNFSWNYTDGLGVGDHYAMHGSSSSSASIDGLWLYHNTLVGGRHGFDPSSDYENWDLTDWHFVNNLFSDVDHAFYSSPWGTFDNASFVGDSDYNWLGTLDSTSNYTRNIPNWIHEDPDAGSNIIYINSDATPLWTNTTKALGPPHPVLPSSGNGSDAIDAGVDISVGFAIRGNTYSALPGYDTDYYSGKPAPDMGITGNIGVNPPPLEQIVIDNDDSTATISTVSSGTWNFASGISGCYGNDCYFNWNSSDTDYYYFRTTHTGETKPYTAYSRWSYRPSRDTTTKYEVRDSTGVIATFTNIDQSVNDNQWNQLGTTSYQFTDWAEVRVYGNGGTNISVSADAVKFEGVTESIVPLSGIITVTSTNTGAEGSTAGLSTSADSTGNMVGSLSVNAPPEDIGVRGDSIGVSTISGALGVAIGMGGSIDVSSTGDISGRVGCASDCAFASSLTNTSTFAINNTPSGTWSTDPRDSSDGWTTDPRDSDDEWTTVPR